jgi:hypothetical protein
MYALFDGLIELYNYLLYHNLLGKYNPSLSKSYMAVDIFIFDVIDEF